MFKNNDSFYSWQFFLQRFVNCFRPRAQQTMKITVPQKFLFKNKYVQNLPETLAKRFKYGWLNVKSYCQWDWLELSQFAVEVVFHFPFRVKIFRQDGNNNNWLLYKKKRLAIWRPKTDLEVPPFSTEAAGWEVKSLRQRQDSVLIWNSKSLAVPTEPAVVSVFENLSLSNRDWFSPN